MENMTNSVWTVFEDEQFSEEEIEYLINLAEGNKIPKLTLKNRIKDMIKKTKNVFLKKDDPFIDGSFLNELEELPFD